MNISKLVVNAFIAGAAVCGPAAHATVLSLPSANEMSVGTYNNFNVYSLDLLAQCAGADARCQPSTGVPLHAAAGQITAQVVVLQTATGQTNFPPFAASDMIDERFLTPTGQQANEYKMGSFVPELGGAFVGDQDNRWEMNLGLLQTYLGGNDLVFMFDNNQAQNDAAVILIWGQARIVDANGNTVNDLCFELSTEGGGCAGDTGFDPVVTTGEFLPAITDFCVDKLDGSSYNIGTATNVNDCAANGDHLAGGYQVNNNLGNGWAEFAAFNLALHNAATNPANAGYFLQLNIQYKANDGGAEQMWLCSDCTVERDIVDVPEPGSLPLILMGLLAGAASVVRARRG